MSTSAQPQLDPTKTVTGYPVPPNTLAASCPTATAAATASSASAAAYPYVFHPPPPSSAPAYYNRPSAPHALLQRLVVLCSAVIFAVFLLYILASAFLKPRIPEFRVASAAVSPLNATGSRLTATWHFALSIRNPNRKLSLYYEQLRARVFYGGDELVLASTQLPPLFQDAGNESRVEFGLAAVREFIGEDAVEGILKGRGSGEVDFGVGVVGRVGFRSGEWRMREHLIRVFCDPVAIGFSGMSNGSGSLTGQPKKCVVYL